MDNKPTNKNIFLVVSLVVFAALTRILPHPPNFTAIGAMALFGVANMRNKWLAFLMPLVALYVSDLFINNVVYAGFYDYFVWRISPFVYVAFILILGIGYWLRSKVTTPNVLKASLATSLLFFLFTNAAVWWVDPMYAKNMAGLMTAYTAGIPFFWNTLAGDLFYSGVLFGVFAWVSKRYTQFA